MSTLAFLAGLTLLVGGGELLVRGASDVARRFGVTPLVVGLTVVAFGTSAPELLVSVTAVLDGRPSIAVGNVVGSNVLNVLLILGVCALVRPLVVANDLVRRDVPVMIAASLLAWLFALDGRIGPVEGALLLGGLVAFVAVTISQGRVAGDAEGAARIAPTGSPAREAGAILLGLVLLVAGARLLVAAAVAMAVTLGLGETVIGLTIVAAGTSLPEVATSVMATLRGERDLAVGNVVGSNVFNVLGILGTTALVGAGLPIEPSVEAFDLPVMTAVAVACLPLFVTGRLLARWEGALFLGYYLAYTAYLVLAATHHDALPRFSAIMLRFVLPLTVVTIAVTLVRTMPRDSRTAPDLRQE